MGAFAMTACSFRPSPRSVWDRPLEYQKKDPGPALHQLYTTQHSRRPLASRTLQVHLPHALFRFTLLQAPSSIRGISNSEGVPQRCGGNALQRRRRVLDARMMTLTHWHRASSPPTTDSDSDAASQSREGTEHCSSVLDLCVAQRVTSACALIPTRDLDPLKIHGAFSDPEDLFLYPLLLIVLFFDLLLDQGFYSFQERADLRVKSIPVLYDICEFGQKNQQIDQTSNKPNFDFIVAGGFQFDIIKQFFRIMLVRFKHFAYLKKFITQVLTSFL
jgi:hypothetical protein